MSVVWFRYRYTGRRHVPATGPVLLVANHQSHLDPVLVGIAAPRRLKYLARHGLFFWPFSWWIQALGAVPIDRERGAVGGIRTTLRLLNEREAVLVFPEGSRTFTGQLQPMRPGFCLLARRTGAVIVPVAIRGAFASMPRGTAYPRPRPISLAFLPSLTPAHYERMTDDELTTAVINSIAAALRHTDDSADVARLECLQQPATSGA